MIYGLLWLSRFNIRNHRIAYFYNPCMCKYNLISILTNEILPLPHFTLNFFITCFWIIWTSLQTYSSNVFKTFKTKYFCLEFYQDGTQNLLLLVARLTDIWNSNNSYKRHQIFYFRIKKNDYYSQALTVCSCKDIDWRPWAEFCNEMGIN